MNKLPSCFRRGQGVVNPNDRQSPLAPFPGQPTPRLDDRRVEFLRPRHSRSLVTPTGKGFMQVSRKQR
jgi:hypothetical protein